MQIKALLCVLIMALLLAGCGDDVTDSTRYTPAKTTTTTTRATIKSTTTRATTKRTTSTAHREDVGQMVWISATGSKYHSRSSCSNMKSPRQVSVSSAKNQGYTACKKCC